MRLGLLGGRDVAESLSPKPMPHTHALVATAKFAAFKAAMAEHATKSIGERERVERDRMENTDYYRAAHPPSEGT